MSNVPSANNLLPGAYSEVITQSRGVTIPSGSRITAIIGEGSADETIVTQAVGGGKDGLNPSYTSTSGADGRHFQLTTYPVISNRTTLFKNGIPLVGLESLIDTNPFSNRYDYRIDISTGRIELQSAHLTDQGGSYYTPVSTNVGQGALNYLQLVDANAPPETWTIRCIAVQRSPLNQPIANTAKFIAFGSISGAKLDANGNPIIWMANNTVVSNHVLSFSISESTPIFREGDAFTIYVASGVLVRNDTLTANYIPEVNINDPVLLQGMDDVISRHGLPSLDNNLSLGAQLAFANQSPALITVQAAPPMPRRNSYILTESMQATSTNDDDFIFPLPAGVVPDFNSNTHFFVTNNATNIETQLLPNKLDFYTLNTSGYPTTNQFIMDNVQAPGGYSYYYTVISQYETIATGFDGYIGRDPSTNYKGVFSSPSTMFDSSYVGKELKIIDAVNTANIATYIINSVSGGKLYVQVSGTSPYFTDFTNEVSGVAFEVIDTSTELPVTGGSAVDGYVTKLVGTATGTFGSLSIDFSSLPGNILTRRLQINGSTYNNGLYDITAYDSLNNVLTIRKAVVSESNMRYEVLDISDSSQYVVLNKNIVPDTYRLRITVIDHKEASFYDAGWINALASLETVECDIVVPLPKQTISVIFQNTLAHCKSMSNIRNRKERVMFIGAISGLTPANLTGATPAAVEDIGILEGIQGDSITEVLSGNVEDLADYSVSNAYGNTFRCVYFYPDQIVVQAGTENVMIDGIYIAPAAAGFLSASVRIENPLTNKTLSGFSILRNKQFSTQTLEQLAQAGVTVLQPVSGGGRVIWGITTSQSGYPEEQEISIVFIRDRLSKVLRAGFQGYIGNPETLDTPSILNTRAVVLMNSFVSQGLITAYKDIVVKQDEMDPRQYNVSVHAQPSYPLNWVYIKVALGQF